MEENESPQVEDGWVSPYITAAREGKKVDFGKYIEDLDPNPDPEQPVQVASGDNIDEEA